MIRLIHLDSKTLKYTINILPIKKFKMHIHNVNIKYQKFLLISLYLKACLAK